MSKTKPSLDTEKDHSISSLATDQVRTADYAIRLSKFLEDEYPILKGIDSTEVSQSFCYNSLIFVRCDLS